MTQPTLKTERLLLRGFDRNDAADVHRMAGNPEVAKQTLNIPHPYLEGMAEDWIENLENGWIDKTTMSFAITLADKETLIGAVGLTRMASTEADLGYWLGEEYWGQGYCSEAVNELIQYSLLNFDLTRIIARHLLSNPASGKVMKNAGMQLIHEGDGIDRYNNSVPFRYYEIKPPELKA